LTDLAAEFVQRSLDGFTVEAVLRETGEGFLLSGRGPNGAPVTIRMLRAPAGTDAAALGEATRVFQEETAALGKLGEATPHVETLLAAGVTTARGGERIAYCVFRRTDGSSLAELRGRGAQPIARAIAALEPIAAALAKAHELGLHHGDVRPENVILVEAARRPTLKLVRFGLGTRFGPGPRAYAPEYGAPEHFERGEARVGPPTDVYGLALTLVELVSGRPPLEGNHPTALFRQASDIHRRPTLRARGATASDEIEAVLVKALAVNPKSRWPNAGELWAALVAAAAPELRAAADESEAELPMTTSTASAPVATVPSEPAPGPGHVRVLRSLLIGLVSGLIFVTALLSAAAR
jgi:serine/threonine-protein kinase